MKHPRMPRETLARPTTARLALLVHSARVKPPGDRMLSRLLLLPTLLAVLAADMHPEAADAKDSSGAWAADQRVVAST